MAEIETYMKSETSQPGKTRVFYGWIVLSGALLAQILAAGSFTHSFGVFFPEITAEFGWSRASLSLGFSLGIMAYGFLSPLWGVLVTRFGPRKSIIAGNFLAAIGVAGLSLVQEIWQVYILYITIGLGIGLAGFVATTTLANNWFIKKIPLVMGFVAAAGGLSGFIFPPFTTALISSIGWRFSWLVLAGLMLAGAVILGGGIMVRNRPEEKGEVPDGNADRGFMSAGSSSELSQPSTSETRLKLSNILRIPSFWSIGTFAAASGCAIGTMTTHQVAYLQDLGFSPMVASTTLSVWAILSVISSIVFGILALRYSLRVMTSIAFIVQIIAMIILLTSRDLSWLYVYSALIGVSIGALVAALPTYVGVYFGRTHYAQIVGLIFTLHILAFSIGGPLGGIIFDITNSYTPAFIIVAAFSTLGLMCVYLTRTVKQL